jgi:hypothetical protein
MSGITIDGRLDDWPKDLRSYPVRNQLLGHPNYDSESREATGDPDASFRVGYDPKAGVIYLAVVVKDADEDVVVHPSSVLRTDAVGSTSPGPSATEDQSDQERPGTAQDRRRNDASAPVRGRARQGLSLW